MAAREECCFDDDGWTRCRSRSQKKRLWFSTKHKIKATDAGQAVVATSEGKKRGCSGRDDLKLGWMDPVAIHCHCPTTVPLPALHSTSCPGNTNDVIRNMSTSIPPPLFGYLFDAFLTNASSSFPQPSAAPGQLAPTYRRLLHDSQGPPSPDFGTASSTCGVFSTTTCFFAHRNGDAVPIFPFHSNTRRPPSAAAGIEISVCRAE